MEQENLEREMAGFIPELVHSGFSLRLELAPAMTTIEVAQTLGNVLEIGQLLPSSGIPTVQSLRPRMINEVGRNQYSGNFGLGVFPLHSDLAHWAVPPHYLLLRCVVGSSDVFTHILSWVPIVTLLGAPALRKAVFSARKRRIGFSGLVRAMSNHDSAEVFRWDAMFLTPLNHHAKVLASVMLDSKWNSQVGKILLSRPGDTLVIDNWRMLHGRGEVMLNGTARQIDRVYLSEVFTCQQR